jgi:hypothetical protein
MYDPENAGTLDYSEASLERVEDMLEEAAAYAEGMTPEEITMLVQSFGCYILEVGRRSLGGHYKWHEKRNQPVLVVGEPDFRVAMITWNKVGVGLAVTPRRTFRFSMPASRSALSGPDRARTFSMFSRTHPSIPRANLT